MKTLIVNAKIVNEGIVTESDLLIDGMFIAKVGKGMQHVQADCVVDAKGNYLLPGAIDDQVHFREPGLTHKADIHSESRAAVAGGVTSFMEMPNTAPPTFTQKLLEEKYSIASNRSVANYSFYIGASNDNIEEVMKTDLSRVCGLKIFMGSSTGNLLVDNEKTLEDFYSKFGGLIATHCEHEPTVRENTERFKAKYGEDMPTAFHALIRDEDACYRSSSIAVALARKHGTRLHILHISTAKETSLFEAIPLTQKKITAEACIHHLWFSDADYEKLGNRIKWNPAVKTAADRDGIWNALLDGRIDVVATDHAPHTLQEKSNTYFKAPSGGPLIQHSMVAMLEFVKQGKIKIEKVAEKMAHNPAVLFAIEKRGFIREGFYADLVLVENKPWEVNNNNILAKCGWSPFEGSTFQSRVSHTWVNGALAWEDGRVVEGVLGKRLTFRAR
jgi:dihydroorotase